MHSLGAFEVILARRKPGWLDEAMRAPLAAAFSSASRSLGKERLTLTEDEASALAAAGLERSAVAHWTVDELGRVALLVKSDAGGAPVAAIEQLYFRGDNRERQAVLKALPLVADPSRCLSLAVEACRTSVDDVFRAIACDNPFPAGHFPPLNFNQMVLKALFTGMPVSGIIGLADRVTPELLRMAGDYAAERRAAGRSVPEDIALLEALAAGAS